MAAPARRIGLRVATDGKQPVLASALADSLTGLQELMFRVGEQRLGREPRASGRPTKEVANTFSLRVEDLRTGSAVVTLALPRSQAKLDLSPPEAAKALADLDQIVALVGRPTATPQDMAAILPDAKRRGLVKRAILRLVPAAPGHVLEITSDSGTVRLQKNDRPIVERLLGGEEEPTAEEFVGRITSLRVDKARTFVVDTSEGQKTVHYPSEVEGSVREALGNIGRVSVQQIGKELHMPPRADIETLPGFPLDVFLVGPSGKTGQIDPPLDLEINPVTDGPSEFYVGAITEFDISVAGKDVSAVVQAAKEALGELWEIYVVTPDEELTGKAKILRHSLMGRLNF